MDIKTYIRIWNQKNYSDGFPENIALDENALTITKRIFETHLEDVKMNGDSAMGLPRNREVEESNDIIYTKIFDRLYNGKFISPAYYLFSITEECIDHNITDENLIWYHMCRGLRSMTSFIREIDLADKIKNRLPECEIERNPELDVRRHIDILVKNNNMDYGVWSYQTTDKGLIKGSDRLSGRCGEIGSGVYILCPFDENDKETYYGWWLHSASYVDEVVRTIEEYDNNRECDNYNEITNYREYMKNIHIFKKGE